MYCWDGGAARTASSEKADGSPVTEVNHFYNGLQNLTYFACRSESAVGVLLTPLGDELGAATSLKSGAGGESST